MNRYRNLTELPSIGPAMEADLHLLGIHSVRALARRSPQRLYDELCARTGARHDPCVLYSFRCAVYAARTPKPSPRLLKWWAWKDRVL